MQLEYSIQSKFPFMCLGCSCLVSVVSANYTAKKFGTHISRSRKGHYYYCPLQSLPKAVSFSRFSFFVFALPIISLHRCVDPRPRPNRIFRLFASHRYAKSSLDRHDTDREQTLVV